MKRHIISQLNQGVRIFDKKIQETELSKLKQSSQLNPLNGRLEVMESLGLLSWQVVAFAQHNPSNGLKYVA